MAIVNRTPDSFYDAGATFALDAALARGLISEGDDQLFLVTDSVEEAVKYIVDTHREMSDPRNLHKYER